MMANDDLRIVGEPAVPSTETLGAASHPEQAACGPDGAGFLPKPVQRPHPPLWIGGRSDAAVRRAARAGDAWHPSHLTVDELRRQIPDLHAECERAGRSPDDVTVATRRRL